MTDRELLKLAAVSAGIEHVTPMMIEWGKWNPLTDDGDALRLAVALRMDIRIKTLPHVVYVEVFNGTAPSVIEPIADIRKQALDEFAATRRAIVRAAAEIGKAMP